MAYLILAFLWAGVGIAVRSIVLPTQLERLHHELLQDINQRSARSLDLAEQSFAKVSGDFYGLALASEVAAQDYDHERAIGYLNQLPRDGGIWEFLAEYGLGKRNEALGRISEAETHYQSALRINPLHIDANMRLGHVLLCSGRAYEAGPCFFRLIQQGKCNGDILLGMSYTDRFFRRDERMENAGMSRNPPDPLMQLSLARKAIHENRTTTAQNLLEAVIQVRPDLGEAQGRLGRIISDLGDHSRFETWRLALPPSAREHPEVLFALGLHASRLGMMEGAARCFVEVLNRSPSHLGSTIHLASCLERLGQTQAAKKLSQRGQILAQLESNLNVIRSDLLEKNLVEMVGEQHQLGRFWEAAGWCYIMQWIYIPQQYPTQMFGVVRPLAVKESRETARGHHPVTDIPVEQFAWPKWPSTSQKEKSLAELQTPDSWRLEDVAHLVGVDFRYFEGTTEQTRLNHIFSTVGGGIGAIDYDRDGWCDLYLPQANDWRNPAPQPEYIDRLYRNTGQNSFQQTTSHAGILETGFSHGVATGDIEQDGFPDLYVCNKGRNRLYWNAGDGTFEDVTETSNSAGDSEDWSTSAAFADFNGDNAPDLYVLNYSPVTPTTEKLCHRNDGTPVACTPGELKSARDRLFINQGDGTFHDATPESELVDPNGRGLGVIVWKFGGDQKLGVFVSNDTTANYLFVNHGNNSNGIPRFQEEGIVRGVAFDADGNAQASMGVAAGDANRDGELELFITNFYNESNTYYSRGADGFFTDMTRSSNLRDASFKMLGFGCQFADLNCDGWPDLIATNGHVDQLTADSTMDRMPPQVFWNQQGEKFKEVPAEVLGPFFQGRYLGRGMAVADWNRDGRADIGISHLHGDLALLSHAVTAHNSFTTAPLTVRLVGTRGSREPVGAMIRVEADHWSEVSLQTGGSGYLVTNEPIHQFHTPLSVKSLRIVVVWPDGTEQSWEQIPAATELTLVEGQSTPIILKHYSR